MRPQFVHPVQELRQEGMQPGGQNFLDVAVLQIGAQLAGAALGLDDWSLATMARLLTTSFRLACSDRGMSARRISRSATRSGSITSR